MLARKISASSGTSVGSNGRSASFGSSRDAIIARPLPGGAVLFGSLSTTPMLASSSRMRSDSAKFLLARALRLRSDLLLCSRRRRLFASPTTVHRRSLSEVYSRTQSLARSTCRQSAAAFDACCPLRYAIRCKAAMPAGVFKIVGQCIKRLRRARSRADTFDSQLVPMTQSLVAPRASPSIVQSIGWR